MLRTNCLFGLTPLILFGFIGLAFPAMAHSSHTSKAEPFQASGKLPKLVSTDLSLSKLAPKDKAKVRDLKPNSNKLCFDTNCDVVIIDGGVRPGLRIVGLVLNIVISFGIGSWIAGDRVGGIIGSTLVPVGLILILISYFAGFALGPAPFYTLMLLGIISATAGYVIPIITVLTFRYSMWRIGPRRRYYRRHHRRRYYRRYDGRVELPSAHPTNTFDRAFQTFVPSKAGFAF